MEQEGAVAPIKAAYLPTRAIFMLIAYRVENFSYGVYDTILDIFLYNKLGKTGSDRLMVESAASTLSYLLDPVGGVLADLVKNKFVVIVITNVIFKLHVSILYLILSFPKFRSWGFIIYCTCWCLDGMDQAIGYSAFDAFELDQFSYPEEYPAYRRYLQWRIVLYHFTQLLAYLMSPLLKTNFACLGDQDCYLIPFTLQLFIMILSQIILFSGYRYYLIKPPEPSSVSNVFPCIFYGFYKWLKNGRTNRLEHWMNHAAPKHSPAIIETAKSLLRLALVSLSVAFIDAIIEIMFYKDHYLRMKFRQRVGSYKMITEHVRLFEAIAPLISIPLIIIFVEPRLKGTKYDRPFKWILFAGIMMATWLFLSGCVASYIQLGVPVLPGEKEAQLRIHNGAECSSTITHMLFYNKSIEIPPRGRFEDKHVSLEGYQIYSMIVEGDCFETAYGESYLEEGQAISVFLQVKDGRMDFITYKEEISLEADINSPMLTVLGAEPEDSVVIEDSKGTRLDIVPTMQEVAGREIVSDGPRTLAIAEDVYTLYHNSKQVLIFDTDVGGIYNIMLFGPNKTADIVEIVHPNTVDFYWWIPLVFLSMTSKYFYEVGLQELFYLECDPGLRGTTESITAVVKASGSLLQPVMEVDWRLDYCFYFYASMFAVLYGCVFVTALNVRSRHADRKLL